MLSENASDDSRTLGVNMRTIAVRHVRGSYGTSRC